MFCFPSIKLGEPRPVHPETNTKAMCGLAEVWEAKPGLPHWLEDFPRDKSSLLTMSQSRQPRSMSKCHLKKKNDVMQKNVHHIHSPNEAVGKTSWLASVMFSFLFHEAKLFFFFLFPHSSWKLLCGQNFETLSVNKRYYHCVPLLRYGLQIVVIHWMITSANTMNIIVWFIKSHKIIPTQM